MNLCLVTIITVIFFLKNENFGTASFLTQTVSTRRLKATCNDTLEEWAKQVRGNQKTGRQMGIESGTPTFLPTFLTEA